MSAPTSGSRPSLSALGITQPDVIGSIQECIGLPGRPSSLAPAHPLTHVELDFGAC